MVFFDSSANFSECRKVLSRSTNVSTKSFHFIMSALNFLLNLSKCVNQCRKLFRGLVNVLVGELEIIHVYCIDLNVSIYKFKNGIIVQSVYVVPWLDIIVEKL